MNINEKDALVNLLEFHLLSFVEETGKYINDADIIGDMYDRAYSLLQDVEMSLDTQVKLNQPKRVK